MHSSQEIIVSALPVPFVSSVVCFHTQRVLTGYHYSGESNKCLRYSIIFQRYQCLLFISTKALFGTYQKNLLQQKLKMEYSGSSKVRTRIIGLCERTFELPLLVSSCVFSPFVCLGEKVFWCTFAPFPEREI